MAALADDTPGAARREQRVDAVAHAGERGARLAGRDEVIALVGEIHRRLEARGQIEQFPVERADGPGERALELIEGHARLEGSDGIDEIRHGLGLHEVHAPVQEGAQRELARLGKPRAGVDGGAHDAAHQRQAAVGADLDDILGGVGMRSRKVRGDDFVDARDFRLRRSGRAGRLRRGRRDSGPFDAPASGSLRASSAA